MSTSVTDVDYHAFKDNGGIGENGDRLVIVYVAPGKKIEFSNYRLEGIGSNYPWATLEHENRIQIVEKE